MTIAAEAKAECKVCVLCGWLAMLVLPLLCGVEIFCVCVCWVCNPDVIAEVWIALKLSCVVCMGWKDGLGKLKINWGSSSTSSMTSGLQTQQTHIQNIPAAHSNGNTNSTSQPHNTHTFLSFGFSSYGHGLSACPYESCIHSYTTATPTYTWPTANINT